MNTSIRTLLILSLGCLSFALVANDLPETNEVSVSQSRKVAHPNLLTFTPQLGSFEATDNRNPVPPSDLTIEEYYGQINLGWTAVSGASRYIVEASNSPTTDFVDVTATGYGGQTSGSIYWISMDVPSYHFYRVRSAQDVPLEGFVLVEGGTFNNGASNVTISSFSMGIYELTQAGYQAVMGINPAFFYGIQNAPVEQISWFNTIEYRNRRSIAEALTPCYSYNDGTDYGTNPANWPTGWNTVDANHTNVSCNWAAGGYRLPSEMEWMFAAKGGNQSNNYVYSGSDDINAVAWWGTYYGGNAGDSTHPVGAKEANELGLWDMSGNVFEWTWDIKGDYPTEDQINPHGMASGNTRVLRGGSWTTDGFKCAVTYRGTGNVLSSGSLMYHVGFRVCRNLP